MIKLLDLIERQKIAKRLDASLTVVSLWLRGKRHILWHHTISLPAMMREAVKLARDRAQQRLTSTPKEEVRQAILTEANAALRR